MRNNESEASGVERDDRLFLSLLRLLMSHINEDGSVGPSQAPISEQRRLTHQTISALLASGISPHTRILQRLLDWLLASAHPRRPSNADFYVVPHKIEAAVEMGKAKEEFCQQAMQHLVARRVSPTHFDIPGESPSLFKTLWILKILTIHPDADDYAPMVRESLEALSGAYRGINHRDLSLLIALYHRSMGNASLRSSPLRDMVDVLIDSQRGGLFDVKIDVERRLADLLEHGLTTDTPAAIEADIHFTLISTCYVISNLVPLTGRSNRISRLVDSSLEALRAILPSDPEQLAAVFPEPYKQVMLTARALVAFSACHETDISSAILPHMIQELVDNDRRAAREKREREKDRLRQVVRKWVQVDWADEDFQRLGGGFSGATVVRLRPKVMIPSGTDGRTLKATFPGFDSVVIKFGEKSQFDKERQNYTTILQPYRRHFAAIPAKSHIEVIDGETVEYLVIEDLVNYTTLQEILPHVRTDFRHYLTGQLIEFLETVYGMPPHNRETIGMPRSLYMTPMFNSLSTIHGFIQRHDILSENDLKSVRNIEILTSNSQLLEHYPVSIMHGDLNIRNILFQGACQMGAELRFRLIDLDKFSRAGDLAYDIGEFVVDVHNVQTRNKLRSTVLDVSDSVESCFRAFAQNREDPTFDLRLQLAKARSLLKLVEIECKLGLRLDTASNDSVGRVQKRIKPLLLRAYGLLDDSVGQILEMQ